jgi:hypothetical protein
MGAALVWSSLALALRSWWAWLVALVLVLSASLSRVYLGVHFITDVIVAWLLSAVMIWAVSRYGQAVWQWLTSLPLRWQLTAVLWATALLVCAALTARGSLDGVADPPSWSRAARGARDLGGFFFQAGQFLGALMGLVLAERWASFDWRAVWWKRALALAYALAGAWLIREAARMVQLPSAETVRLGFEFSKGLLLNAWILFAAPWILLAVDLQFRSFPPRKQIPELERSGE